MNSSASKWAGLVGALLVTLASSGIAAAQIGKVDPFARYDARLSDAASRTLDRVVQPDSPTTTTQSFPKAEEVPTPAPPRGNPSALQRVERLRPALEPILREVGVPTELAAVVLVESGGEPTALSPKGARGLWQLMPDTARRYGLVVDGGRDERLDVFKSTRAAAEYLRDLYAQFRDWQLALAAYNAGEQAVQRALVRAGTTAFPIASQGLPDETQRYVPAVLKAFARFGVDAPVQLTRYASSSRVVYAVARQ